jgi:hypothetical protein
MNWQVYNELLNNQIIEIKKMKSKEIIEILELIIEVLKGILHLKVQQKTNQMNLQMKKNLG